MKKSLVKTLARMARDGDPEAVAAMAELLEEFADGEVAEPAETAAEAVAEAVETAGEASTTASGGSLVEAEVIRNEQAPQCGAATIENAETVVVDEAALADIVSRLDQIISLLSPAPAADETPAGEAAEQIAEAVKEAVEVAAEEAAEPEILPEVISPEEISEIVGEILEPENNSESTIQNSELSGDEDPDGEPCQEVLPAGDALRAALCAVRPALAKMPKKQRQSVCADIAARLNGNRDLRGTDAGVYAALASARRRPAGNPADLGRRIMETRSANRSRR